MNVAKKDYINNWLFRENEDIEVIESLIKLDIAKYSSTICFHAQQAVEKYLKAFLVFSDIDFQKTHDLDFLLCECQKVDNIHFNTFDFKSLTDYGVFVRYPDDFYISDVAETMEYAEMAIKTKNVITKLIKL